MDIYSPQPLPLVSLLPKNHNAKISDQLLVSDVQIDSRYVSPGALFIALKGKADDGAKYIADAVEHGAAAVLVDESRLASVFNLEIPVIGITDLYNELPKIAQRFFGKQKQDMHLVGVTGTNGKSSIVSFVAQLNRAAGSPAATVGTLGYGLLGKPLCHTGMTTPDVVSCHRILAELYDEHATTVAMEVSSHGIHQKRIAGLAFDVCVLSNITRDHLDYHGSFRAYANVKKSLLLDEQCKAAVINYDDEECRELAQRLKAKGKACVTYSVLFCEENAADVYAKVSSFDPEGMRVRIFSPWTDDAGVEVFIPLVGLFNLGNLLSAFAASALMKLDVSRLLAGMEKVYAVDGRMQCVDLPVDTAVTKAPRVYIDYAHTPDALEQVLLALRSHTREKLWVVFGCGGDRDRGKRTLMGAVAHTLADRVVLTSDNPRSEDPASILAEVRSGIQNDALVDVFVERQAAIAFAIDSAGEDDVVLVAGKGHEDYQIIGNEKRPFSDYLVAKDCLAHRIGAWQVAK